ncbi:hypothetical protein O6P37_00465 [Mycobacterium sp. CPCC 205372]|uniref:Uncharacterized protein n=1 Tax=Mycobacterium hippophais TaxID=3016340 RepID=A0ABT4PLA3_9MYCO|nr:hypothetical protein [Mycobacterium hippophais]MCZ8377324.1 hypothetical protein [Mycobacterium hippophais]
MRSPLPLAEAVAAEAVAFADPRIDLLDPHLAPLFPAAIRPL